MSMAPLLTILLAMIALSQATDYYQLAVYSDINCTNFDTLVTLPLMNSTGFVCTNLAYEIQENGVYSVKYAADNVVSGYSSVDCSGTPVKYALNVVRYLVDFCRV
jgi:hypothetical protein